MSGSIAAAEPDHRPEPLPVTDSLRTAEGRTLFYVEAGCGPDVVLIHGTLTTADDMRLGPMPALAERAHAVAFDRPGHGRSDHHRLADSSLWAQLATIRAAVLELGLRRPVICGHSSGGAIALAYGLAHPDEIAGVVALAPICFPEPRLEQMLFGPRALPGWGDWLSSAGGLSFDRLLLPVLWNAMFLPQSMPPRFAADFPFRLAGHPRRLVNEGENAVAMWSDLTRAAALYPTCRAPVHIIAGSADIVVNPALHGRQAARMIPGAQFTSLPGIGHMLHHVRVDAVTEAVFAMAGERLATPDERAEFG